MPKYRIVCFSDDLIEIAGKLRITTLKPTIEKEITLGEDIRLDEEDELYSKLKDHIYGVECRKLLVISLNNGREEPKEVLINLARKFNDYVLHPRISKILEVSILARQNIENVEENVIVAKMLKEERIAIQGDYFVQEGHIEVVAPENSSDGVVGIKLVTDRGERILLLKEKANKLPEVKEKKAKKKR